MTLQADWQRILYGSGEPVTPIYPGAIRERKFIDVLENPYDPTSNIPSITQYVVIPEDGMVELDYLPYDSPTSDALIVRDTGGTALQAITGNGSLTATQYRVYPGKPCIDFDPSVAGQTFSVTIRAAGSVVTASIMNRLFSEIRAMASSSSISASYTVTAAEDIPADSLVYFTYEDGAVKCRLAVNTDVDKYARGYVATAASSGAGAVIVMNGMVTGIGSLREFAPPDNASLFLSKVAGYYTWIGDGDTTYNLGDGQARQYCGFHINSGIGFIHVVGNPFYAVV